MLPSLRLPRTPASLIQGGGRPTDPAADAGWWESEPNVGRVAHGVPLRVDRLRGLGNAVVPAQAREAFERLMGLSKLSEGEGGVKSLRFTTTQKYVT